jgi:hypothetical protein
MQKRKQSNNNNSNNNNFINTYLRCYLERIIVIQLNSSLSTCKIIIVTIIPYYKKRLRRTFLAPNASTSLQTTSATDEYLAEG